MKRIFPEMYDRPDNWMPAVGLAYWIFAFFVGPTWLPMIADGYWDDLVAVSWLDIVYHAINAVVVAVVFKNYAVDSFLNVQLDTAKFFKTVGVALLAMLVVAVEMYLFPVPMVIDAYPINEMTLAISGGFMVDQLPLFGILCHVLLAPLAVVGLFYVPVFAPMCCRKTWLGYLMVTIALAIPPFFDYLWRGGEEFLIPTFLLNLPIHLIACWSYQKADTVWAPLATLSVFNLITSLLSMFFIA